MYSTEDRITTIELIGEQFELLCTTRTLKTFMSRYGDEKNMKKKLQSASEGIDTLLFIFVEMNNAARSYRYKQQQTEELEILTMDDVLDMPLNMEEFTKMAEVIMNTFDKAKETDVKTKKGKASSKNMKATR